MAFGRLNLALKIALVLFLPIIGIGTNCGGAFAAESKIDKRVAKKISKEKGLLEPKAILEWNADLKTTSPDSIKLDNKYFSVSYPKCFSVVGEAKEENPKISSSVVFFRSESCAGFLKGGGDSNSFSISYFPYSGFKNLDGTMTAEPPLIRQKLKINGIEAKLFAGLLDSANEIESTYEPQLRWQIFVFCKEKPFRIAGTLPPGGPTMERVDKSNYDFPEDFTKIVATFTCNGS